MWFKAESKLIQNFYVNRPAFAMINDAEKKNLISPGKVGWIVDANCEIIYDSNFGVEWL